MEGVGCSKSGERAAVAVPTAYMNSFGCARFGDITESIQDACEVDVIKTLPIACQKPRPSRPEGPGELCRQPPPARRNSWESEELLGIGASWRQTCGASQVSITRCRGYPLGRRYLIPETSSPNFLHRKYVPGQLQSMVSCFQHP